MALPEISREWSLKDAIPNDSKVSRKSGAIHVSTPIFLTPTSDFPFSRGHAEIQQRWGLHVGITVVHIQQEGVSIK
jgi:hypothetical protein